MWSGTSSLGSATSPSGNSGKSRTSATTRAYRRGRAAQRGAALPFGRHGHTPALRPARPAGGRAAAASHGRADAARRAGGELLVPAPSRGLRVDRGARARPPRRRPRLRGGLRQRGARPHRRRRRGRRCQPGGVRARAAEVHARERRLRARHDRDVDGRRRLRRLPPDDRARARPRRRARAAVRARRGERRRLLLDPERADAGARGPGAFGQPVARARVPPGRVPRAVRAPFRPRRPARPVPRAQAAPARACAGARRLGSAAPPPAPDPAVLRPLGAGDLDARLPPAARRARPLARPARRAAPMSRAPGALAIVLHTHMPYVEGFGTWPFGEEWLWEAIATSYLPLLDVLDAHPGRITLSLTPVLCDQLEAGGVPQRFLTFLREIRAQTHRRDIAAAEDAGVARELERSAGLYARAAERFEARGGDLIGAFAPHVSWTSSATHAVLPMLATSAGVRLQVGAGIASHRERFGHWDGGFWLPECGQAPWLDPLLEEPGVHAVCLDLTDVLGYGSPAQLQPLRSAAGPLLVPIDRALMDLVWHNSGYPSAAAYRNTHNHTEYRHTPWAVDGAPYDPARGRSEE